MRIARTVLNGLSTFLVEDNGVYYRATADLSSGFGKSDEVVENPVLETPIVPTTIYAIGLNYRQHALEMDQPIPEYPVVTMKSPTSLLAPEGAIRLPRFLNSDSVDYECELAIVIGKECKNIKKEDAFDYIAGYTVANDVSARDWQKIYSGGQWCKGKTFDTFCPLGPIMVTSDEITDPDNLGIRTYLNGEVMQDSNTSDMIFSVSELVAFLSGSTTLLPGTVILTGTPTGVGAARKPQRFLQAGDKVTIEIDGIGKLNNTVVEEPV